MPKGTVINLIKEMGQDSLGYAIRFLKNGKEVKIMINLKLRKISF